MWEHPRAVCNGVHNGRIELPQDLLELLLEIFVDLDVLIVAELFVRLFEAGGIDIPV